MKPIVAACAGALVLAAVGPSAAADIPPATPYYRAPVAVAVPVYNWSGFFVGIQGGYARGNDSIALSGDPTVAPFFTAGVYPATIAGHPRGFLGGIEYGTNWQFGNIVLGTESDLSFGDIRRVATYTATGLGTTYQTTGEQKLSWFSTSRVRAGLALDNWLLFVSGGLADARAEVNVASTSIAPGCLLALCPIGSTRKTLWGWTAGGGIEYGMGPWSAKVEYLHYDLGNRSFLYYDPNTVASVFTANTKFSGEIVRGAINYRFTWTPMELVFGR